MPRKHASVVATLILLLICAAVLFAPNLFVAYRDRAVMENVLNRYVFAIAREDYSKARSYLASDSGPQALIVERHLTGVSDSVLVTFEGLTVDTVSPYQLFIGPKAMVVGTVRFGDGLTGSFIAILRLENGQWRVRQLSLTDQKPK